MTRKRMLALVLVSALSLSACHSGTTEEKSEIEQVEQEGVVTSAPTKIEATTPSPTTVPSPTTAPSPTLAPTPTQEAGVTTLEPYADIFAQYQTHVFHEGEYKPEDIYTYSFQDDIYFEGSEEIKEDVMEEGKNPGLGIRQLHEEQITGEGVNVAIIDQNLLLNHSEYEGKIVEYYDTGCNVPEGNCSMHGPAVTSLLVGETIGVAPGAKVYYAAAPTWTLDASYYAEALDWIVEKNKTLGDDEKIRVVSVSACPSGDGSPFEKNLEMWDEAVDKALEEGILVIDCRTILKTGFIEAACIDLENREDPSLCTGGFPIYPYVIKKTKVGVPNSYRTVAQIFEQDKSSYLYTGLGGLSWAIPYASGVLALGWQVNPKLDQDEIVQILIQTCSVGKDGSNIINPPAFIEAVKKTVE